MRPRLQQVDVDQQQLVVEALDLRGEGRQDPESRGYVPGAQQQPRQAGVEALAQEGALLGAGPGGLLLADAELSVRLGW